MHTALLQPEVQQYIRQHTNTDVAQLALQKSYFPDIPKTEILNQIAARKKAENKLPTWYNSNNIIYPSKISVEQTSSEITAKYKSGLVSGESLIDLTGGFGVDDYYFSKTINTVVHCEANQELSALVTHNFKILDAGNIECIPGDSLQILERKNKKFNWIYIDPSRRNEAKGKVFMLKDCLPDVPGLLATYFEFSNNILIKTAPLLDITAGLNELHSVKQIHIVAVNNEVKELLWLLEKGFTGTPLLHTVNLGKDKEEVFETYLEPDSEAIYSPPQKYLYEPNSAIMKSGAFGTVSTHYKLGKLHKHSHLYTSEKLIDFPGRAFTISEVIPYHKSDIKTTVEGRKLNISSRNFPLSVPDLKKKWKIKDGGDEYAFFTTNLNNEKIILLCQKA